MKQYPKELFYIGDTSLLKAPKISIVGSRKPNSYAKTLTTKIASKLSKNKVCIVSGAAMGIDAIAHTSCGFNNTIAVVANGLDKRYPAVNKNIIENIEQQGLVLSQFKQGQSATKYNFVLRNEVVVALGDALIVTYADRNSGSLRSVEFALKMGKPIYVLPHRIGESEGTNDLLEKGLAKAIYDVDKFVNSFGYPSSIILNKHMEYFATNPTYEEAMKKYPQEVFEYELKGDIKIVNGSVEVQ